MSREKIKQQSRLIEKDNRGLQKQQLITSTEYIIEIQREKLEKSLSKVDKMLPEDDKKAEKKEDSLTKFAKHERDDQQNIKEVVYEKCSHNLRGFHLISYG